MRNSDSIIFLLMLVCVQVSAQQRSPKTTVKKPGTTSKTVKPTPVKMGIQAVHYIQNKRIKIRWAPTDEQSWRLGNKYGYILEKRTIVRDENFLSGAEQIKTFRTYLLIKDSLRYWEPMLNINDNAAVMAQALYGETFELDLNNKASEGLSKGTSLLSKAQENKQRYLFAMFAADNDFSVAERAGLGFVDTATKFNERYFYRIYSAAPKSILKSDTAFLFVSFKDIMQLPPAADLTTEPSNKSIVLTWDIERTKSYYNSFIIQRSSDSGRNFRNLNLKPYTSMAMGADPTKPNSIVYVDTLVETGKTYQYRVSGISIFGERGPWSKISEVKSVPLLEGVPGIQGIALGNTGEPILKWYFEYSVRSKISGFEVNYSPVANGVYGKILENIPAHKSEVFLPDTLSSGYLIVKAVSKEGISRTSFPYLYQMEDSIPPGVPAGLSASVDTLGHVELKWLPNPEKDLLGYKVFRTMIKGSEHAVLVDTVWYNTVYRDTLDLKLMNRKVYYAVTALDFRFNQSKLSNDVEVIKPDIIPPTPPVFEDYKLTTGAVELFWVTPAEEDLREVKLLRKPAVGEWTEIFHTSAKSVKSYKDKKVEADKKYSYKLIAVDSAGLNSPEAQILTLQTLPVIDRKAISSFDFDIDRDKRLVYLRWQVADKYSVKSIEIFRGTSEEPLSLYKVLDGKTRDMLDNDLLVNTKYKYGVRLVLSNGTYSELVTKEINY
ncbi:MAG: hypothetical protein K2X48_09140 [Chitinophagaceae bacterium]|nr:hypothetical protein [Chitinophagaceae bacterium]